MSEELLLNDRRVEKIHNSLWSRSITRCTDQSGYQDLSVDMLKGFQISNKLYFGVRAIEITQNEEWKREKVTWEIKELSRRKLSSKKFAKKRPTRLQ